MGRNLVFGVAWCRRPPTFRRRCHAAAILTPLLQEPTAAKLSVTSEPGERVEGLPTGGGLPLHRLSCENVPVSQARATPGGLLLVSVLQRSRLEAASTSSGPAHFVGVTCTTRDAANWRLGPRWHDIMPIRSAAKVAPSKKGKASKGQGWPGAGGEGEFVGKQDSLVDECLVGEPLEEEWRDMEMFEHDMMVAKEYSSRMMELHHKQRGGESVRLRLKAAAISALPEGRLREAARTPDFTPFPPKMLAPSLTPPIEAAARESEAARSKPVRKIR